MKRHLISSIWATLAACTPVDSGAPLGSGGQLGGGGASGAVGSAGPGFAGLDGLASGEAGGSGRGGSGALGSGAAVGTAGDGSAGSIGSAGLNSGGTSGSGGSATYYVSPAGNDTNPGTLAAPFATLERARAAVRAINSNMTSDILVYVMKGEYYVSKTIELTDEDSGTNGFTIYYKNYDAVGAARIIGGAKVTEWKPHSGSIYKADVGKDWSFHTLYENGKRARKARTANLASDAKYPMAQAAYLKAVSVQDSSTVLQYNAGELDPTDWKSDAQVFIWSGGAGTHEWDWFTDTVPIASVDKATRRITLAQPTRYTIVNGSRYFVQGALSLLDQAGEFYLDTATGTLYYWPMDGAIADQTIIAPKVQRLISLVGSSETSRVHNVRFEGLSFESTDFTNWYRWGWVKSGDSKEEHQYPDFDRQIEMPANRTGMLFMQNTDNIQFRFCRLKNSGYSAAYLFGYNQHDTFYGNSIEHTGYAGVFLTGNYPGEGDVSKNNVVSNNKIHDIGELVGHPSGVYLLNAGHNEVSYSEIYNSPRYGICYLGIKDASSSAIYTRNNVFKYLKIHDCSQDSGDTAPLYAFGLSKTTPYVSNSIEQVTIDRVYAHPAMRDYVPVGIYMDNQTNGQSFKNVKLTSVGGKLFSNNESGNHTNVNVNWTGTFDDTKMEYGSIGVKADFPAEYN